MKITALLTLQILFFASLAQARPEVVFPAEAEISNVNSAQILEVAELKDFSGEAFSEISSMVLWEAAAEDSSGAGITLSGAEISKKLRDHIANSAVLKKSNPTFKIPEQVKLSFAKGVSRAATERGLKNVLLSKCPTCVYQIKISSVPTLATKTWSVDYGQDLKNGAMMLTVQDSGNGANQWISGSYHVRKKVPVLKRSVRFGERLQADDIELAEADITFLRETPPEMSELIGMLASRTLQAKTAAVLSDFKREPAAKRGQILKALVGNDSFEVSINVTAEENGTVGDLIKVQNPETRKMMSALIVEKGVVKVQ